MERSLNPHAHARRSLPARTRVGRGEVLVLLLIGATSCRSALQGERELGASAALHPAPTAHLAPEPQPDGSAPSDPTQVDSTQPDSAPAAVSSDDPVAELGSSSAQTAATTQAATPTSDAAALVATTEGGLALSGSLMSRWRMRKSGSATDQDVYAVLAFDVGDSNSDPISGHFLGRLSADIDGQGDTQTQQVFGSLQDTYGDAAHLDLYEVSVAILQPFDAPVRVRVGRQFDYATPEFAHYDGLRVESEPMGDVKIVAGAFGGVPVRLYDATSIGDRIVGAWTEARPWTGGRVRADWMHLHQDSAPSDYYNDLLGLSIWQRMGAHVLLDAGYTRLEEEDRDVRLRATYDDGEGDLMVQAGYYRLLNPQADFAYEFDPFYATLQEYQPFDQFRLLVSKSLGDDLRLDVGGDLRDLENEDDENFLNHGYERGYATFVISDILARGLDLSLTGDAWSSDDRDIRTWGLDVTWTPDSTWRASVGSSYALYKYDVAQDIERDDVRVWYARARRKLDTAWTIDLAYEYEDDDFDDFHQITAGATWHF